MQNLFRLQRKMPSRVLYFIAKLLVEFFVVNETIIIPGRECGPAFLSRKINHGFFRGTLARKKPSCMHKIQHKIIEVRQS